MKLPSATRFVFKGFQVDFCILIDNRGTRLA
jgi:hypothetical protein